MPLETLAAIDRLADHPGRADPLVGLLGRWLELGEVDRRAFMAMTDELTASSVLVETSTVELCSRFRDLAQAAAAQTARVEHIASIAGTVDIQGRGMPIAEATQLVANALREGIAALQDAAQRASDTAAVLDNVERDVCEAEKSVKRIATINTTTRFVALNAMIEANRVEGSSGAFRVIANEIKDLSLETNTASSMVRDQIDRIARAVRNARQQLRAIGQGDQSDRDRLNARLLQVLEGMNTQSILLSTILAEASQAACEIDRTVSQMITSAQFQDRVTQQITHISDAIETLGEITAELQSDTRVHVAALRDHNGVDDSLLRRLLDRQTLSSVRRRFFQRLIDGSEPEAIEESHAGEIELF